MRGSEGMYIKILTPNAIEYIKKNYVELFKKITNNNIAQVLNEELITEWNEESKFISREIKFYMPDGVKPILTDFENAKLIYESFNDLTESQASDERFWSGYAIKEDVYNYLKYRWGDNHNLLKYRVVFHAPGKRGLLYHGIARLWWLARLTIDEEKVNMYELTEFTFNYPHIMEKMIYRNFSNSKNVRHGIIEGIKKYIKHGGEYRIAKIDELYLYISTISSVHLLDSFSKEEIVNLTYKFLINLEN